MFRGAAEDFSTVTACKSCTHNLPLQISLCKSCPPPAVPSATYFGPQGGEGVCPCNPVLLEVLTTKVNIIRTNAPGHRWGFEPRPPRLAHQNYSIYSTNSSAESGPKLVSEMKPDLGVASTFCPECSVPHIVLPQRALPAPVGVADDGLESYV